MDILSEERPDKLEHHYLGSGPATDQELENSKANHVKADEDLFPIQVYICMLMMIYKSAKVCHLWYHSLISLTNIVLDTPI